MVGIYLFTHKQQILAFFYLAPILFDSHLLHSKGFNFRHTYISEGFIKYHPHPCSHFTFSPFSVVPSYLLCGVFIVGESRSRRIWPCGCTLFHSLQSILFIFHVVFVLNRLIGKFFYYRVCLYIGN